MSPLVNCPRCSTRVLPMAGEICPACRHRIDPASAPPPPAPPPPTRQAVEAGYTFAAQELHAGAPATHVRKALTERGWNDEEARTMVGDLRRTRVDEQKAAEKDVIFGALWCFGGVLVTAATYQAAVAGGGGTYIVAWGAIAVGAIQLCRGLTRSGRQ